MFNYSSNQNDSTGHHQLLPLSLQQEFSAGCEHRLGCEKNLEIALGASIKLTEHSFLLYTAESIILTVAKCLKNCPVQVF